MAVAPASMADKIIVLDDEDGVDSPQPSCSTAASPKERQTKIQQPVSTHITQSPFASSKKEVTVLRAENQKLFTEFVEHCSALTKDCPEVLTFLQTKHTKACPNYLSSVEFRNTLGRCLTRAQANQSKTFVYINELCTVLRQHAAKKRHIVLKADHSTSSSSTHQSTSVSLKSKFKEEENGVDLTAERDQPSTSAVQDDSKEEAEEAERKNKRASRKQIAYLENLLRVYNDEICRLQQAELSLDELGAEDSTYIQEHKLKRKMMKIYEKLCELKGCNTLTGRVIEQRIPYSSTRYPEINRRIERFINSAEAHANPPDYLDILQQVTRTNARHNLCLSKRQLTQIAQDAFRETGSRMQERRHLDLVYNFGSHLTDTYKPGTDPALSDRSLMRKLQSNREVAVSRLEEVITKYAVKQEDSEEQERSKRLEKDSRDKEAHKLGKEAGSKEANGVEEEDEDEEEEEDASSDPDIEEEIQASTQQEGPDDDNEDADEDADANEGETREDQSSDQEGGVSAGEEAPATSGSPVSDETKSQISPLSDLPSPRDSPGQSEAAPPDHQQPLSNGDPVDSSNQVSIVFVRTNPVSQDAGVGSPAAANGEASPAPRTVTVEQCDTQTSNGTSPPPSPRTTRGAKRKREETTPEDIKHQIIRDSEADIPLDMGVVSYCSPAWAESSRADTPTQDLVSSSQSTPPPKRNKVNVATQCDPDEIIVLSDSD